MLFMTGQFDPVAAHLHFDVSSTPGLHLQLHALDFFVPAEAGDNLINKKIAPPQREELDEQGTLQLFRAPFKEEGAVVIQPLAPSP